jgi:hypothetical protein
VTNLVGIAKIQGLDIHSPKFNSGLFRVQWTDTEAILTKVLGENPEVKWTVWTGED